MGAQHNDSTAKNGLRLLNRYYRQHPTRSAEGHSYVSNAPRATSTAPGMPYNADVVDLIDASLREVADHTRKVNPDAAPLPPVVEDIYDWHRQETRHADERQRQRGEVMVYRQQLEYAIARGEASVIRPHRCPACKTFGLMWKRELQRVLCTNQRCLTRDGMSRTWSLAELAYKHVVAEKSVRVRAT